MPTTPHGSYREAIGRRISEARTVRSLSRQELGDAIGVSPRTIANWELATNMPAADDLGRLASALGISLDWLVGSPEGETVLLINQRTEMLLKSSKENNALFRARHSMLATMADEAAMRVPNMHEFVLRLREIDRHREQLPRVGGDEHAEPEV